jgi:mycothiol synthase
MSTSTPETGQTVTRLTRLGPDEIDQVLKLAESASDTDGAYPLSEQVVLNARHGGQVSVVHLLIRDADGALAGYGSVDTADPVEGAEAELVVHPMRRRRGLGLALVEAALDVAGRDDPRGRLRLWAHGDHPSASALGLRLDFHRARTLLRMRRSLSTALPETRLPAGLSLRHFRPGVDEVDWLALNARAFADHPEQGRWTSRDLAERMAEPWFDPTGFLLATDADGRLLGFHWTKTHGGPPESGDAPPRRPHESIGEVYVVGVDPAEHGRGLGRALTVAGLCHLRSMGIRQAMLYVDESNTRALALYTWLGFSRWSADVNYRR